MVSGAALVLQRLAEGFAARDHSVLVLTASDRGQAYTERINGLKAIRLRSFQNPLRDHHRFVLWSYNHILNAIRQFQPDVLHLHDPLNFGLSGLRAARQLNIPTIITIHQLPWFISLYVSKAPPIKHLVESCIWCYGKWFLKQCDALITPSQMIADIVSANTDCCPEVISNGIDLRLFSPSATHRNESEELCNKYHLCSERPIILYVGRIDVDKKVELIVYAAAKIMRAVDAQLVIVGDGKEREKVKRLSLSLGIYQDCCFPGFVPKSGDLPGIYRLATVFVTASEIEVQSSVVLEGAASGLPVITVQASSMPEFVIDGESGYLVSPGDVNAISERLISLLSNQTKAKMMGQAGRVMAEKHSNERSQQAHEQLYESLAFPA
jgi:glycosyltransferase involved in cell wall biosynthesis